MKASLWYKEFGAGIEERYYHITAVEEGGSVSGHIFTYSLLLRRVLKEEPGIFDDKWWMEQELRNVIHEVPEDTVPFLMPV